MRAADQLIAEANASPVLQKVYVEGLPPAPQVNLDDRPREGRRVRRHLRGHQQHDLDQSRLELHQRLPESRPHAARDRAGRQHQPHERRRHPELQRQEQPRPAGAVLVVRDGRMGEGADPDRRLQLLSGGAHHRRGEAGLHLGRRDRRDGAAGRQAAARLRLRMDRAVAAGEAVGLAGAVPARAVGAASCSSVSPRSTRAGPFRSRCC